MALKGDARMQHMRRSTDKSEVKGKEIFSMLLVGILVFVGITPIFSSFFGLDPRIGAWVLGGMILCSGIFGLSVWCWLYDNYHTSLVHPGNIWPILLAMLWSCWWPALDFWESETLAPFSSHNIWWAAWYTKSIIFFAFIFVGYGIKGLWRRH
jgi:hypothetical protein